MKGKKARKKSSANEMKKSNRTKQKLVMETYLVQKIPKFSARAKHRKSAKVAYLQGGSMPMK
eukprot:10262517-Karenia_brevis.AAC.1